MFNRRLKKKVQPFLMDCGFMLIDETAESMEFVSPKMVVKFEERDRSIQVLIGWRDDHLVLLDRFSLYNLLGSMKELERVSPAQIADNVLSLFQGECCRLLVGDKKELQRLMEYHQDLPDWNK